MAIEREIKTKIALGSPGDSITVTMSGNGVRLAVTQRGTDQRDDPGGHAEVVLTPTELRELVNVLVGK